jgi:hypothetical protein
MINNLKCKLGIHSWTGSFQCSEIQKSTWEIIQSIRACKHCGKKEELDIHCLGLNPPEYVRTWLPVSAARYNIIWNNHWDNILKNKDETTEQVVNLKTLPHYKMINGIWTEVKK